MFPTSLVPADAYRHPYLEGPRFYVLNADPGESIPGEPTPGESAAGGRLFSRAFRRNRLRHARIGVVTLRLHHGFGAPSTRSSVVNR